jgi:hypothetical protein
MRFICFVLFLALSALTAGCAVDPKTRTTRLTCTDAGDAKYAVTRTMGVPLALEVDERDAADCKARAAAVAAASAASTPNGKP